jgi:hypothetical protein
VLAELGWWGLRHRPSSEPLRVRAHVLHDGGPGLWDDFMNELRPRKDLRPAKRERSALPDPARGAYNRTAGPRDQVRTDEEE